MTDLPTDLPSLYALQADLRRQLADVGAAIVIATVEERRRQGYDVLPYRPLYRLQPTGPGGEPSVLHTEKCDGAAGLPYLDREQAIFALSSPPGATVPCVRCRPDEVLGPAGPW